MRFSEAKQFRMGTVVARRIVHPELGAKRLTLNHAISQPGNEFSQHVHDGCDDTILVLEGEADLRQGDTKRRMTAGQAAFVPAGQIHGTITTGTGAVMISFQTPPDMVLYTGERDSSRPGAAAPEGAITAGAVKFTNFAEKNGFFVHPGMGAQRVAVAHWKLGPGEKFSTSAAAGGEQVLFVLKGAIVVRERESHTVVEKDTVLIRGPAQIEIRNESTSEAVLIQAQAPDGRRFNTEAKPFL